MSHYQPHTMLVTGGAGFIGSHFIRYFLAHYPLVKIINLDLLTYAGSLNNLVDLPNQQQHEFIKGDICDKKLVDILLRKYQIDTIVHFAAESHVDRSVVDPKSFMETNVIGTFTLLQAAREYWLQERQFSSHTCRFHHVSTDEVYGSLGDDDPPFSEEMPLMPNSPYSASKASSDHLVRAYFHTYGLPVTLTNCSNNYGSHQHAEKLIPTIIRCCMEKLPIPIYGNGKNKRDWLHVADHCKALDVVLHKGKPGEKYNIGGNAEYQNLAIAEKICAIMDGFFPDPGGHKALISFVADRPGHDWRYAINNHKIFKELGWSPEVSFEQGLAQTVQWFVNHQLGVVALC